MPYIPAEEFLLIWLMLLYPAKDEPILVDGRKILVGKDQYINRLIQFINSKSGSKTYADIAGADLGSIGKRIDAINNAVCKGTHSDVTKEEASRYIIHTYLLISDIISLNDILIRKCSPNKESILVLY